MHGPVDAWLSSDKAAKQSRAEALQQRQHPRNQGKLLLDLDAYLTPTGRGSCQPGSSNNSALGPVPLQQGPLAGAGACIELKYQDLSHKASCHLQRHPVLAAHDRLLRVTVDRHAVLYSGKVRLSRPERQAREAARERALQDVLNHGVMLAGRKYNR